ncbi:MAG: hypothetical protein ACKOCT_21945 [Alphaproteobacteria bacterium]
MADRRLLRSSAGDVPPAAQAAVERALLAAAHRGEIRLHVSALAGRVLSIGAHAPRLASPPGGAGGAVGADGVARRRRTGGRPVACGSGFRVVSLALPGRSSLLGAQASSIAPEQVMNRAVRGFLEGLRRLGLDPSYPGLDLVTVGGRSLAHLSFAESARGAVLFEAVLACGETLAESTRLLDELDPGGSLPTTPVAPGSATCLAHLAGTRRGAGTIPADALVDPPVDLLADVLARSWADAAGLDVLASEPPPADEGADAHADSGDGEFPPAPQRCAVVMAPSRLGIALAWARTSDGRVVEAAVGGDMIARDGARERVARAVRGCRAEPGSIARALDAVLDRDKTWLLGITPDELAALVARAAAGEP